MHYEEPTPGVFVVRYANDSELIAARQGELVAAIHRLGAGKPVAIVFVLDPAVCRVHPQVTDFWLDVIEGHGQRLRAIAIVSESLDVHLAARAFATACSRRDLDTAVEIFSAEQGSLEWVSARVAAGSGVRAAP